MNTLNAILLGCVFFLICLLLFSFYMGWRRSKRTVAAMNKVAKGYQESEKARKQAIHDMLQNHYYLKGEDLTDKENLLISKESQCYLEIFGGFMLDPPKGVNAVPKCLGDLVVAYQQIEPSTNNAPIYKTFNELKNEHDVLTELKKTLEAQLAEATDALQQCFPDYAKAHDIPWDENESLTLETMLALLSDGKGPLESEADFSLEDEVDETSITEASAPETELEEEVNADSETEKEDEKKAVGQETAPEVKGKTQEDQEKAKAATKVRETKKATRVAEVVDSEPQSEANKEPPEENAA